MLQKFNVQKYICKLSNTIYYLITLLNKINIKINSDENKKT